LHLVQPIFELHLPLPPLSVIQLVLFEQLQVSQQLLIYLNPVAVISLLQLPTLPAPFYFPLQPFQPPPSSWPKPLLSQPLRLSIRQQPLLLLPLISSLQLLSQLFLLHASLWRSFPPVLFYLPLLSFLLHKPPLFLFFFEPLPRPLLLLSSRQLRPSLWQVLLPLWLPPLL